jgi:hypothetical protein
MISESVGSFKSLRKTIKPFGNMNKVPEHIFHRNQMKI